MVKEGVIADSRPVITQAGSCAEPQAIAAPRAVVAALPYLTPQREDSTQVWSDRLLKRSFDVVVSAAVLIVLSVPFVIIALAIKLDSRGPVFYRSRRVGYQGRELHMLKFRKMRHGSEGMPLTAGDDQRFTRVGRLLARSRVDELPQLWDVLRGRMSIVGPRPEDPGFVALRRGEYDRILRVRPGVTGLSQIAFAEEHKILDPEDMLADYVARIFPQKVGLDILYAERDSLRMDVAVVVWTVAAVVMRQQVAVNRSTGALTLRRRQTSYGRPSQTVSSETTIAA